MTILTSIIGLWVGLWVAGWLIKLLLSHPTLFIGMLSATMLLLGALVGAYVGGLL